MSSTSSTFDTEKNGHHGRMMAFQQDLWALAQNGDQPVTFVDGNLLGTVNHLAGVLCLSHDHEGVTSMVIRRQ